MRLVAFFETKLDVVEITDVVDSVLFNSWTEGSYTSSGTAVVVASVNVV